MKKIILLIFALLFSRSLETQEEDVSSVYDKRTSEDEVESNLFPIYMCGGNSQPTPDPLPGIDCIRHIEPVGDPIRVLPISIVTGSSALTPIDLYKCHVVVVRKTCFVYFLGVKTRSESSFHRQANREECQEALDQHSAGKVIMSVQKPQEYCWWMQTNHREHRNILFERTSGFFDILGNYVKVPGSNKIWEINEGLFQDSLNFLYIPESSFKIMNITKKRYSRTIDCEVFTDRIRCPTESTTIYFTELIPVQIQSYKFMKAANGFYILHDNHWEEVLKTIRVRKKRSDLHSQYYLERITELERNIKYLIESISCSDRKLRRELAIAISHVSPSSAAHIEFGKFIPGVSLTPAGVVKYSCQRVYYWTLRDSNEHVTQVPISYAMYAAMPPIDGWFDPRTMSVVKSLTSGPRTRYVQVNSSFTYDLGLKKRLDPVPHEFIMKLSQYPIHGLMSYLQDEIETAGTLANTLSLLRASKPVVKDPSGEEGFLEYGKRIDHIQDAVTSSKSWFSNLVPSWMSIFFDFGGSLVTTILVVFVSYKLVRSYVRSRDKKKLRVATVPDYDPDLNNPMIRFRDRLN